MKSRSEFEPVILRAVGSIVMVPEGHVALDGRDGRAHHRREHDLKEDVGRMGPREGEVEVADVGGCPARVRK